MGIIIVVHDNEQVLNSAQGPRVALPAPRPSEANGFRRHSSNCRIPATVQGPLFCQRRNRSRLSYAIIEHMFPLSVRARIVQNAIVFISALAKNSCALRTDLFIII